MKRSFALLCVACLLLASGLARSQQQSEYAQLVARIKKGDVYISFKRLRLAYAVSPERQSAKDIQKEKNLSAAAIEQNDFAKAIEYTDLVLDYDYTSITAHVIEARAYRKLKDEDKASFHQAIAAGLLSSIIETSGESKKDAWVVISEEEEKAVLSLLELRAVSHTPIQDGKHSYELVEVINPATNKTIKRYFNLDLLPKS